MSTYFELCNAVLQELGYRTKSSFTEFTTREELEIKRKVSDINRDVLLDNNLMVRKRYTQITVPANSTEYTNNINGEIVIQDGGIVDLTNKTKYQYNDNHEDFFLGTSAQEDYGVFNGKLLFTPNSSDRILNVYYYTYHSAKDNAGLDKSVLSLTDDTSIIPFNLQTKILVNGTCYELKKRGDNSRIAYWETEFVKGKNMLNSYSSTEDAKSKIVIGSEQFSVVRNI